MNENRRTRKTNHKFPMKLSFFVTTSAIAVAGTLAGCTEPEPKPEVIRPVQAIVVTPTAGAVASYAGEVKPRYETQLAFRIPGLMVARRVEVGSVVRQGQVVATLDARDLKLSRAASQAQLAQADSQARLAEADYKRYSELRRKNFISQAEFEQREAQYTQAREVTAAARAAAAQSINQTDYSTLVAPHAGVITAIEVEAGQVVSAGQTVVRLARMESKEIAFSVPEHMLRSVRDAGQFEVRLWANPEVVYSGSLRELSPVADSASRTYAARLSLPLADAAVSYGMTAEVRVHPPQSEQLQVPLTALFQSQEQKNVWIIEGDPQIARRVAVTLGSVNGDAVQITGGLHRGQVVVTAGARSLTDGQKVRLRDSISLASNGVQP